MQNEITTAVRKLRLALGDTQQQFAQRMKMAISSVVRYELSRPPRGKALAQFALLAQQNDLHDLARVFAYAAGNAPETKALHAAIDVLWYNRESVQGWDTLADAIEDELKSLIELKRTQPDLIAESMPELEDQLNRLRLVLFGTAGGYVSSKGRAIGWVDPRKKTAPKGKNRGKR
jgi:transcriptional regulator with XRE-family HTH domain